MGYRFCFMLFWLFSWQFSELAQAYTANKVSFDFLENGLYRVNVYYTVPEVKEFRQSYVLFKKKREAEIFYWKLLRGADFYPENPELTRFVQPRMKPEPW